MILSIVVILFVLGVAFFHYVQGFFSATLSAIMAIVSAVLALSLQETLTEGPLAGTAPEWMPSIVLLLLFAIIYVILRTIFDKLVPGNVRMPALLEKIGGAVMGLVAAVFSVGICVIALEQMPLGPSLAGYTRYETDGQRNVTATAQSGSGYNSIRAKDAATFNELTSDHFDKDKATRLMLPVDDIVVSAAEHLSDNGSLQNDKPLKTIHPALLDELFGERLGYQFGVNRTAVNAESKNKAEVSVEGVFVLPPKPEPSDPLFNAAVDSEFKKVRSTPLTLKPLPGDEMRIAVRVKLAESMADKDHLIRLSPGAVRLVAYAQDELDPTGEAEPRDYYPIGTLAANGLLYLNKVDDPLIILSKAPKAAGAGDGPAVVDFVFQVKDKGFLEGGNEKPAAAAAAAGAAPTFKIASGTFIEVKKFARVDLSGKEVKPLTTNVPVLAVKRKHLEWEKGPPPPEPGKIAGVAPEPTAAAPAPAAGAAPAAAASTPAAAAAAPPAPTGAAPAPDANMSKMVGTWENDTGLSYTFRGDGTYSGTQAAVGDKKAAAGGGTWKVTGTDGANIKVDLISSKTGKPLPTEWDVSKSAQGEIQRVDKPSTFKRKG